jgi:hypothetical protein
MEILLSTRGGRADDVNSLLGWIADNPALSGRVRLAASVPVRGAQGPGVDAIAVAVGSGGTITTLALCLKTWIEQHFAQRGTSVHVEVTVKGGVKGVIDASNADDAERILRRLMGEDQPG